jgi:hypothetical protein
MVPIIFCVVDMPVISATTRHQYTMVLPHCLLLSMYSVTARTPNVEIDPVV